MTLVLLVMLVLLVLSVSWQQDRSRIADVLGVVVVMSCMYYVQEIGSLLPVLAPAGTRYLVLP
jgi:hypothetical protein